MTLLDELRNVEPGKTGQWSRRVSVTLACLLLALVTAVGLQVRVRAKLLPQLAGIGENISDLEEKLQEARRAERRTQLLRTDLEQLEEQLGQTGARMPRGAESLDLAVSLAAGSLRSPVEEVRPSQPAGEMSRRFRHVGAEMQMAGNSAEIVGAVVHVMAAAELRELAEFSIESGDGPESGPLRAGARLLAYFADERQAEGLLGIGAASRRRRKFRPRAWISGHPSPRGPGRSALALLKRPGNSGIRRSEAASSRSATGATGSWTTPRAGRACVRKRHDRVRPKGLACGLLARLRLTGAGRRSRTHLP